MSCGVDGKVKMSVEHEPIVQGHVIVVLGLGYGAHGLLLVCRDYWRSMEVSGGLLSAGDLL